MNGGPAALAPRRAGGRPRLTTDEDIAFIIQTATTRPARPGRPFTHWSVRKLPDHLARHSDRRVVIGREHLRRLLHRRGVTFQSVRTYAYRSYVIRDIHPARQRLARPTGPPGPVARGLPQRSAAMTRTSNANSSTPSTSNSATASTPTKFSSTSPSRRTTCQRSKLSRTQSPTLPKEDRRPKTVPLFCVPPVGADSLHQRPGTASLWTGNAPATWPDSNQL
ncbi:helix-turn-helix domain-containing protein [Nonomuraea antimicrobica]|uniref:helix-turn-helix domain-containing protein n=1 Tax=Nonomuraea antimicrobica TaxID=561173 RepID=UPI003CD0586E